MFKSIIVSLMYVRNGRGWVLKGKAQGLAKGFLGFCTEGMPFTIQKLIPMPKSEKGLQLQPEQTIPDLVS